MLGVPEKTAVDKHCVPLRADARFYKSALLREQLVCTDTGNLSALTNPRCKLLGLLGWV